MRRIISFICGGFFLMSAAGCIDSTTTVIVKKDGTGFITETTYMKTQMMGQMMGQMADEMGGEGSVSISESSGKGMKIDEAKYKAKAVKMGEGVTYCKATQVKNDVGSEGVQVIYKFTDINKIKISQNPDGPGDGASGGGMMESEEPASNPITFSFTPGDVAKLTVKMPAPPAASEQADTEMNEGDLVMEEAEMGPDDAQGMAMMKAMFTGMRVRMMIKVEGEITDTNASFTYSGSKSGKKCFVSLFDMNIGKLMENPENMAKLQALGPGSDISAAKEALKDIDGIKVETEPVVNISFK